jgi:hypothetical protein
MKKFVNLALAIAAATACSAASADMITFESVAPDIFNGGQTFTDGLTTMTVIGDGFSGATVGAGDTFACDIMVCPKGNPTSYYLGLNDGALSVKFTAGNAIRLQGLDFGFVLPLPMAIDGPVGRLQVTGIRMNGTQASISKDFSLQDANGDYGFTRWNFNGNFGQTDFKSIMFNACVYDLDGACSSQADNLAQFAIDNIAVAVPEPSTWLLMGLGLAGVGAFARRKSV